MMPSDESVPGSVWPESTRTGFDPELAGKRAECDGGMVSAEGAASRDDFAGRLSGVYVEYGDPPQRWYLLEELTVKPADYGEDRVWCDREFVFVEGE
ncbi:MAG TPA: hypothetical protein QGF05_04655 [Dehalococcoidia bacterium]|nr:hypothetical protein [Dehalococcoidia bacterium]